LGISRGISVLGREPGLPQAFVGRQSVPRPWARYRTWSACAQTPSKWSSWARWRRKNQP